MNKYKVLKTFRVISSLSVLLILLSIFLLPKSTFTAAAYWQVLPASLRTMSLFTIQTVIISILIILLPIILGRVYCSFLCPLGTLQDIVIRLAKTIRLPRYSKSFTPHHRILRYSLLAILLTALLGSVALPLAFFDPFAIFGRFSAAVVKPSFIWLNNLLVDNAVFENLYPLHNLPFSLPLLLLGGGIITVIMIAASLYGRVFCNTLCPAGTVLGLLTRISWFKTVLNHHACVKCGKCTKVCKSNCIDIKNCIVDNERCVKCFNCTAVCDYTAINYVHQKTDTPIKPDISRRDFLVIGGSAVLGAAVLPKLLCNTPTHQAVMPPGALSFDRFTSKCTSCQLCISNCPGNVLKPAALQYGLSGFIQPRLDFSSGMCEFECTVCSNICPNGALIPLTVKRKKSLQIGLAKFSSKRCIVTTDHTHCGACAEHCPTGAVHMVNWKEGLTIPKMKPELCIGCGGCEYICPVRPNKAIIVSGVKKQIKVKTAITKQVTDHLKGKDFPF